MWNYGVLTYYAVCRCTVGSVRNRSNVTGRFQYTERKVLRFYLVILRIRSLAVRSNILKEDGARGVRLRLTTFRRIYELLFSLFGRFSTCNACATSGRIRGLMF